MPVVTLTTDFGVADSFVGIMKGVMLNICPDIVPVDITHNIAPQDIRQGAYIISSAFSFFPRGTVHLCVVDPGVGSRRRAIAFEAGGRHFVGPDNGVFTEIINRFHPAAIYELADEERMLTPVSSTFHGRDVFAPAAGWLARGANISSFGPVVEDARKLDLPTQVQSAPNMIEGEVIHIDHFGNAVTNLTQGLLRRVQRDIGAESVEIQIHGEIVNDIMPSYNAAPDGRLCAVFGSSDTLELFVRNKNASAINGISVGDRVEARFY